MRRGVIARYLTRGHAIGTLWSRQTHATSTTSVQLAPEAALDHAPLPLRAQEIEDLVGVQAVDHETDDPPCERIEHEPHGRRRETPLQAEHAEKEDREDPVHEQMHVEAL